MMVPTTRDTAEMIALRHRLIFMSVPEALRLAAQLSEQDKPLLAEYLTDQCLEKLRQQRRS